MARKGGNPDIAKHGFKKGDPRINRTGLQKRTPKLKALMDLLLGSDDDNIEKSEVALIIKELIKEAKNGRNKVAAAKEILDRIYGKAPQQIAIDDETRQLIWHETKTYVDPKKKTK